MMNIVAIRKGALGDSLLTFPILLALRERYPNTHITFVGHPAVLPLALAWNIAEQAFNYEDMLWDEVFTYEGIQSSSLRKLFQQTDLAVCWVQDRAGVVKPNLLNAGVKDVVLGPWCAPENPVKHMVEYLSEPLSIQIEKGFVIPSIDWNNRFALENPPIAIHPGSSSADRRWPAASFAAVINKLLRLKHPILLLAGPSEAEVLNEVRRRLSVPPHTELLSILQNAPLLEVAHRLTQCHFYLGNDSGIGHMAGMLGTPTLVLFGPSNTLCMPPHVMHPLGPYVETIQARPLKRLSPNKVIEQILSQLPQKSYMHR
jgi:heptosyltransferase-3